MRDKIAKWVYLAVKRRGLGWRLVKVLYRLTLSPGFVPRLYWRGERLWSTEMFEEQLRESGMGD